MVTPRCSADFCKSLKIESRRVSMNFRPAARAPLVSEALPPVSCELRLVSVDGRLVCIRRWSTPQIWDIDIPGFTGQYVEIPGNLTVAEARIISTPPVRALLRRPECEGNSPTSPLDPPRARSRKTRALVVPRRTRSEERRVGKECRSRWSP